MKIAMVMIANLYYSLQYAKCCFKHLTRTFHQILTKRNPNISNSKSASPSFFFLTFTEMSTLICSCLAQKKILASRSTHPIPIWVNPIGFTFKHTLKLTTCHLRHRITPLAQATNNYSLVFLSSAWHHPTPSDSIFPQASHTHGHSMKS